MKTIYRTHRKKRGITMILAEKIIKMRKANGWSQEDLAMHMGVSRQSVSKWESMASIPDLDKIVKMSQLFGVSTDYLLKDDMEEDLGPELTIDYHEDDYPKRKVTLDEANEYMALRCMASVRLAAGVAACIFSPVILILLSGFADSGIVSMTENMAAGFGTAIMLIIIACAVMTFITTGMKTKKYEYMEHELLDLEYGVSGIVETKKDYYAAAHKMSIALGVGLCILGVVPLFLALAFTENDSVMVTMVGLLLTFIAVGVFMIVRTAMVQETYDHLLEEGEYTPEKKLTAKKNDNLSTAYWCSVVAIYLLWSFLTMKWHITWIIWPVAGVLYGAVCAIANMIRTK